MNRESGVSQLLGLGVVSHPLGLELFNGPQVALQGIPRHLRGRLKHAVLLPEPFRRGLDLQPQLLGGAVGKSAEVHPLQAQPGEHLLPPDVKAAQGKADGLLLLHAVLHPGQVPPGGGGGLELLHSGQPLQGLGQPVQQLQISLPGDFRHLLALPQQ